ncbi:LuxR C-terminal-related transcriptional regulator, partial [Streptomyces longwoodensis]|uniref:helix-turn-helix transcriptional regulator n=1 Tax=Streptomyces longwoodensis TaxID=68231 RepID=UPI0033F158CA
QDRVSVRVYATDQILEAGITSQLRQRPEVQVLRTDEPDMERVALIAGEDLSEATLVLLRRLSRTKQTRTALLVSRISESDLLLVVECRVSALIYRRQATPERLVATVKKISEGKACMPGELLQQLLEQVNQVQQQVLHPRGLTMTGLTEREARILDLAADGRSTCEIARGIGYSERTVKTVLNALQVRLGLRNRTHVVAHAIRQGLI